MTTPEPTLNRVAMHWAVKAEMYLGPILHHGEDGLQSVELTHDGDGLLVPSICTLEDLLSDQVQGQDVLRQGKVNLQNLLLDAD